MLEFPSHHRRWFNTRYSDTLFGDRNGNPTRSSTNIQDLPDLKAHNEKRKGYYLSGRRDRTSEQLSHNLGRMLVAS
jgi:hypothetical protein